MAFIVSGHRWQLTSRFLPSFHNQNTDQFSFCLVQRNVGLWVSRETAKSQWLAETYQVRGGDKSRKRFNRTTGFALRDARRLVGLGGLGAAGGALELVL
jgi:hypothetical protein